MPRLNSPSASSGASVRPLAFVRASLRRLRSSLAGSRRKSSTRMPAAGRPRTVSRTWVVRRPDIRSSRPLDEALDQAIGLARGVEDLALVLHPETLEVVEQMVLVEIGIASCRERV